MYDFRDTIDNSSVGNILPTEAMSYNGVFLENEIQGYRTLSVEGRELMESDVSDDVINLIDGAKYFGRRYPTRTITVTYQLKCDDQFKFRESYNKLNKLLSGENVQIIFNDELDKYFVGTMIDNTKPEKGVNNVVGEIEIYCPKPFKYATTLKTVSAKVNSDGILEANINNNGTIPVSLNYDVTNNAETGYIGIVSDQGVMQFGKIDELDGEDYQESEMLVTLNDFFNAPDDTTGTDYMHPTYGCKGTLSTANWFNNKFLCFGTKGATVGAANGGLRTITIPADSSGKTGAKNFYSYFHLIFYASLMGQTGEMCINWLTEDNKLIAGVNWYKTDCSGNTANYELVVGDGNTGRKVLQQYSYQTNHIQSQNPWYWDWGHCDLKKEGSKLTFFYWGGYLSYIVPEVENLECRKIQIAIKQWGDRGGNQFMGMAGFNVFNFTKLNVDKWKDNPNRFRAGTKCTVNGDEAKFYVDGMYKPDDEVIGTTYFKAPVGESKVQINVSDFTKTKPTVNVTYREAWL